MPEIGGIRQDNAQERADSRQQRLVSARANKHNQFSPINQAILGVSATPQPNLAPISPNKIQHIYDVIDRKSVKNREKMQQDLTRIYMMQVNNKQEGSGGAMPMGG